MGGYAAYVWPAYGVTALVLVWMLVTTLRGLRRREAIVRTLEAARPSRVARNGKTPAATGATGAAATAATGESDGK